MLQTTLCPYPGVFVLQLFKHVCLICGILRSASLQAISAPFELQCEPAGISRVQNSRPLPLVQIGSVLLPLPGHCCSG